MSRSVAYAGPSYPGTPRLKKDPKPYVRKEGYKPTGPCELHPEAGIRLRRGKEHCDECLREQDRRSNHARDAKPAACELSRHW